MKKQLVISLVIAVIIIGGALWYLAQPKQGSEKVLSDAISLTVLTTGGNPNGKAFVSVPYLSTLKELRMVSVGIDKNANGAFEAEEWVVKNVPVFPKSNWNNNLFFTADNLGQSKKVRVIAAKESVNDDLLLQPAPTGIEYVEKDVTITSYEFGSLFSFENVTKPEETMKAGAPAGQGGNQPSTDTPDIRQRKDECAPTAAANSLIRLAAEHGEVDKLPKDPYDLVDQLKKDMGWTVQNGVLPEDFVAGKDRWAASVGLPIRTQLAGDKDGASTLDAIRDAINNGGAAEMRIRFTPVGKRKVVGGHLVTVTDVRTVDGHEFVDIHDPASPSGTDTYEVVGNQLIGYGPADKLDTYIGIGFVQIWEGTPTGASLDPMSDREIQGIRDFAGQPDLIKVLDIGGKYVTLDQVHEFKGESKEECDAEAHYHANRGSVTALDGTVIVDPGGCGLGKVKDIPVKDVPRPTK